MEGQDRIDAIQSQIGNRKSQISLHQPGARTGGQEADAPWGLVKTRL
jgi:hypothetical protein